MSVTAIAPPCESLKAAFKSAKAALLERFQTASNVDALMHALARATDDALKGAWDACEMPPWAALVAVGGYGRGELAPYSDVDILVLLPDHKPADSGDAELTARIERFIGMAWDLGLDIGSSVRSVAQCIDEASNDVTVLTSLLEARRVHGDTPLFQLFRERYQQTLDPRAFFQAKVLEMRQRHAKFQDTPYSLEPNIKESPGGLRDLQLILWISRAAGFGSSWRELDLRGLITEREARELRRNEGFLKTLRARLHVIAEASPGHPRVRPADAARRKLRLHGDRDQARQRTTDAPLLLGRQGRHPARDDPDPERRGAAVPVDERHHARDFGTFRRETGHARNRPRRRVRARTARDSRSVPAVRADARREGPFRAHAARDLQRARPDGPQLAARPGKPRGFSWKS